LTAAATQDTEANREPSPRAPTREQTRIAGAPPRAAGTAGSAPTVTPRAPGRGRSAPGRGFNDLGRAPAVAGAVEADRAPPEKLTPRRRAHHRGVREVQQDVSFHPPVRPVKAEGPRVHSFSPEDEPPLSGRAAARSVPPWLAQAAVHRLNFRARLVWSDPIAPSGRREEIFRFSDPRRLLDLLRRVEQTPARPLLSIRLEAIARARWEDVGIDFVRWRAAQRERRDEVKRVLAERGGGR